MREKIADSKQLSIAAPEPEEMLEELPASNTASSSEVVVATEVQLCPGYAASSVSWSPVGLQIEEVEGARLVYKEQVVTESVPQALQLKPSLHQYEISWCSYRCGIYLLVVLLASRLT